MEFAQFFTLRFFPNTFLPQIFLVDGLIGLKMEVAPWHVVEELNKRPDLAPIHVQDRLEQSVWMVETGHWEIQQQFVMKMTVQVTAPLKYDTAVTFIKPSLPYLFK